MAVHPGSMPRVRVRNCSSAKGKMVRLAARRQMQLAGTEAALTPLFNISTTALLRSY